MSGIKWAIEPDDIHWEMDWSGKNPDGSRRCPDKPEKEMMFESEYALAHLLINEVIFLNSNWWEDNWPEDAKKTVALCVNCNDIFAWGCADAEGVFYHELKSLYEMWIANPVWGAAKWCCLRRNQKPQPPVERDMKRDGVWDDDMENLGKNTQDAEVKAALYQAIKINSDTL